jgi:hypothetical protein
MKTGKSLIVAAIAALMLAASPALLAEEEGGMSAEEAAMMQKWMEYATPGEPHAKLAERAGEWTFTTRMWQHPGAEPEESAGTATTEMILGGRYLVDKTKGTAMGMPFEGLGITGYDNLNKELVGVWVDSFGTGIMTSRGSCNEDWSVCKYEGVGPDPMSGANKTVRMVDRKIDEDTFVFEMYDKTPDGQEWKAFEITYKRKK